MSLKRTPLRRVASLQGRHGLSRKPKEAKPKLSKESAEVAFNRSGGRCACGCSRPATEWHHVFDQARFPELVDEPDNVVAVATACHKAHTDAFRRLPRYAVRRAERLATTEMRKAYLETHYDERPLP